MPTPTRKQGSGSLSMFDPNPPDRSVQDTKDISGSESRRAPGSECNLSYRQVYSFRVAGDMRGTVSFIVVFILCLV